MATRNPNDMRPDLRELYTEFSRRMKSLGIDFILTNVARTLIEQKAYYAQGREILDVTNSLRSKAGLKSITESENKKIVTWTLKSKHVIDDNNPKSRAFDIVIMQGSKPVWNVNADTNNDHHPDYQQAGILWKSLSLKCRWGGDFGDQPHFEVI